MKTTILKKDLKNLNSASLFSQLKVVGFFGIFSSNNMFYLLHLLSFWLAWF